MASSSPKTLQALQTLQKHYLRLLRTWPNDALRSVTFHDSIRRRLQYNFSNPVQSPATPRLIDESYEKAQLNALYSLLENRYSRLYPISERLLSPASMPSYYKDLAAEMEAAPNRSWFAKKWLRLSKIVRFS